MVPMFCASAHLTLKPGLLLGRRERRTCSIPLSVPLLEVDVKSEQPDLVLRSLAPSSVWLTLAGVVCALSPNTPLLHSFGGCLVSITRSGKELVKQLELYAHGKC